MKLLTFSAPRSRFCLARVPISFIAGLTILSFLSACQSSKAPADGASPKGEASTQPSSDLGTVKQSVQSDEKLDVNSEEPSAKKAAKVLSVLPSDELVQPVINSKKLSPYKGETGTIRGVVRAIGDSSPARPEVLKKIDSSCNKARTMFGSLFREGEKRELADVLVAVTEYEGFIPAKGVEVKVLAKGCAWPSRTIAMTYGQRLSIDGLDNRPYVPEILGQPMPAQLFVLPSAPPVHLPPKKPGRYKLVDSMRLYNVAELFVLAYSTVDVTDELGAFEVTGIPVGKVKVNAYLPQTGATSVKDVVVEANKITDLSFELAFNLKEYEKKEKPTPLDELPAPK